MLNYKNAFKYDKSTKIFIRTTYDLHKVASLTDGGGMIIMNLRLVFSRHKRQRTSLERIKISVML